MSSDVRLKRKLESGSRPLPGQVESNPIEPVIDIESLCQLIAGTDTEVPVHRQSQCADGREKIAVSEKIHAQQLAASVETARVGK